MCPTPMPADSATFSEPAGREPCRTAFPRAESLPEPREFRERLAPARLTKRGQKIPYAVPDPCVSLSPSSEILSTERGPTISEPTAPIVYRTSRRYTDSRGQLKLGFCGQFFRCHRIGG